MRLIRAALGADGGMGGAQTGELGRQGTERQARDMQVMDGTGMMQLFGNADVGRRIRINSAPAAASHLEVEQE